MKTEKEALAYLEITDAELIKAEAEATAELSSVQATVAEHEAALLEFRRNGHGVLDAVAARTFLRSLDSLLFPGHVATNAATADAQRENFFRSSHARLAGEARELYLRSHVEPLATAIQVIISTRSKNRDAWRRKVVAQLQALQSRQMLGEDLTVDESRRIESLDRCLGEADSTFAEANNAILKFRAAPTMEHFNDVRRLANQIDYEAAP